MRMKNPAYPGRSVRYDYWDSVAEGAKVLGVTRQAMNNLVSGKARTPTSEEKPPSNPLRMMVTVQSGQPRQSP
jgi:hypothetical protein